MTDSECIAALEKRVEEVEAALAAKADLIDIDALGMLVSNNDDDILGLGEAIQALRSKVERITLKAGDEDFIRS